MHVQFKGQRQVSKVKQTDKKEKAEFFLLFMNVGPQWVRRSSTQGRVVGVSFIAAGGLKYLDRKLMEKVCFSFTVPYYGLLLCERQGRKLSQ